MGVGVGEAEERRGRRRSTYNEKGVKSLKIAKDDAEREEKKKEKKTREEEDESVVLK